MGGREMREEAAAPLQHSLHTISFTVQKFLFELQAGAWNSQRCLLLLLDVLMTAPGVATPLPRCGVSVGWCVDLDVRSSVFAKLLLVPRSHGGVRNGWDLRGE